MDLRIVRHHLLRLTCDATCWSIRAVHSFISHRLGDFEYACLCPYKGSYVFEDLLGLKTCAIPGSHLHNLVLVSAVGI